jgi:type I restriction enzyme M protein
MQNKGTDLISENRHERVESERFKCLAYDDLVKRDKVNLDIFWLKDESLEDSANRAAPDIIAGDGIGSPVMA